MTRRGLPARVCTQVASDAWKKTLDAVVPAVVVLKVTQTRSFDTEPAGKRAAVHALASPVCLDTLGHMLGPWEPALAPAVRQGLARGPDNTGLLPLAAAYPPSLPSHTRTLHVRSGTPCHCLRPAGSSYATGFVVDRARGLILTNRHVVTPGEVAWLRCAGRPAWHARRWTPSMQSCFDGEPQPGRAPPEVQPWAGKYRDARRYGASPLQGQWWRRLSF